MGIADVGSRTECYRRFVEAAWRWLSLFNVHTHLCRPTFNCFFSVCENARWHVARTGEGRFISGLRCTRGYLAGNAPDRETSLISPPPFSLALRSTLHASCERIKRYAFTRRILLRNVGEATRFMHSPGMFFVFGDFSRFSF